MDKGEETQGIAQCKQTCGGYHEHLVGGGTGGATPVVAAPLTRLQRL
jgi:hypothetical protein